MCSEGKEKIKMSVLSFINTNYSLIYSWYGEPRTVMSGRVLTAPDSSRHAKCSHSLSNTTNRHMAVIWSGSREKPHSPTKHVPKLEN